MLKNTIMCCNCLIVIITVRWTYTAVYTHTTYSCTHTHAEYRHAAACNVQEETEARRTSLETPQSIHAAAFVL